MSRADVGELTAAELLRQPYGDRETCAHGHEWRPETTRWRQRRNRKGHSAAVERDCLVCKAVSEHKRRMRRVAEKRGPADPGESAESR